MKARLVCELAVDGVPVAVAYRVLKLSRTAHYDGLVRSPSARHGADEVLTTTITEVHARSRGPTAHRGSTPSYDWVWGFGADASGWPG